MTVFGVHTGLQHTTADELRSVWRTIEDLGFGWISIWDHFYGATGKADDADEEHDKEKPRRGKGNNKMGDQAS